MKKLLSSILAIVMVSTLTLATLATSPATILEDIANSTIQITETADGNGTATTFENLSEFVDVAQSSCPYLSRYEIATFLMEYTRQDYDGLSENEILHFLTYDNITTSTSYIVIDENGEQFISNTEYSPYADWTSNNGNMKITTNYSYRKTVGNEKYYEVWARASWINFPDLSTQDAFVLGTTGTFDDSFSEYGSVSQLFECTSGCTRLTSLFRSVSNTKTTDEDLELRYDCFVPELHFIPFSPHCEFCAGGSTDYSFTVYVRYGMIADETVNIQAGYAHKTVGLGDISVGIDATGTPSFSVGRGSVTEYIARPVTVTY